MTETYGPEDASIPAWTAPADSPEMAYGVSAHGVPGPGGSRSPSAPGATYGPPPGDGMPTHRSWQPGIMPLRPMTFGDFLAVPFKAIRFNRSVVIGGPLACFLAVGLVTTLAIWMTFSDLGVSSLYAGLPSDSNGLRGETIAVLVLAGAMWLLADAFARGIVAPGVARGVLGEHISLGRAWGMLRARAWQVLGLYGLATAITLVPLAIFGGLIALATTAGSGAAAGVLVIVIIASVLLIPFAVVYGVLMGVAVPLVVLERGGVMASARRTFSLIKGRFWWSVLISFVASMLIGIVASVLTNVLQFGGVIVLAAVPSTSDAATLIFITVSTLASYLISAVLDACYLGSTFTLVYIDLRIRHEGFDSDLAEAAEARARR